MFKGRKPILTQLQPRPPSAHPGREALLSLPRPYKKHKADIKRAYDKREKGMDLDRFRYAPSEKDIRVENEPEGVLAIHLLELSSVSVRVTKFNQNAPMFFYCLVSVGTIRRMSKVVQSDTRQRVRMDSTIYFTIQVSEERDDYHNKLRIELWAFQEPEHHYIIGTKDEHIYRIIQTVHGIDKKVMWADGLMAASVVYEYAFAYGVFGYGHSDQLKNTDRSIFESVNNSLFPRIRLGPDDVIDNKFNTRIPTKLQAMSVNSFIFETPNSEKFYSEKGNTPDPAEMVEPRFFTAHQVEFDEGIPVYCKVNMSIYQKEFESDFNETYGEYVCLTTRRDRLEYLRGMLGGRLEDLVESEVGPLFMDLDEGVIESIIDAEAFPAVRVIYPQTRPCMEYHQAVVLKEDEPFLNMFPSTPWSPGWLARVFGYDKPSADPHFGEGDYPLVETKEEIKIKRTCCQRLRFRIKYLWNRFASVMYEVFQFIFPELKRPREIPEISVTTASPQGSTTDLFTRWVNEELEHPQQISEQKAAQESNLLSIHAERKPYVDEPDSEDESLDTVEEDSEFQIEEGDILKIEDFDD